MKRIIAIILTIFILSSMSFALAADIAEGEKRAVLGANLDENQIENIYKVFGIKRGDVKELRVSIDQERKYLEGLVDSAKMGSRSYSSIYIETLPEGSGIEVETHNIDWCSKEMYISALTTAGVEDCKVIVAAPFNVSGTAALTGVYLAYEDMSGEEMDELAKQIGAEELTVTAELAKAGSHRLGGDSQRAQAHPGRNQKHDGRRAQGRDNQDSRSPRRNAYRFSDR